ncbi:glycosyltransferase family 2 protein [Nodosilinea nodulosa]|uniref:glycosyltransferase family 2 protein n=1 Tax=Nodosilinea nodulosa TaxID=416001 RepID=UPI000316F535|nr:glycosyltransferase family 2 protein [Nodosilinea nodulosa]
MTPSSSIYILIPVHNRRATTLTCLDALHRNGDMEQYRVVVIDDGSTDGTAEAIRSTYPAVTVLSGDGTLWWTGAIKQGMQYAYAKGASHFVWLNDDTLPAEGAISLLIAACYKDAQKIVAAQCYSPTNYKIPTYSGQVKRFLSLQLLFVPEGKEKSCDCMSGNLVCLPRSVVDQIDYPPSHKLPQCLADVVYTWEAKKAGYSLKVLGDAKALCEFNSLEQNWSSSPMPIWHQWQRLTTPKSNLYPPAYWHYCISFYGLLAPLAFTSIYFKLLLFTLARWLLPISHLKKLKDLKNQWVNPS